MELLQFSRRRFLMTAAKAGLAIPVLGVTVSQLAGCSNANGYESNAGPLTWKTAIAAVSEPGEPLIVTGTIYQPDGRTPASEMVLGVYQTDVTGIYSPTGDNGIHRDTRIHGAVKTGTDGRYEIRTIKPGSYPQSTNPAHIHAYLSGPGFPEYWIDDYWFADDKFVKEDQRNKSMSMGSFAPVMKLSRGSDGVLRATRDIKLEKCSRNCTGILR